MFLNDHDTMGTVFIFMIFYKLVQCFEQSRYLVYPPGFGNKVQFIVGIGIPVTDLPALQSVTWGYVIKTNYALPTNVTQYGDARSRKRSVGFTTRWDFYRSVTDVIDRSGLPGEECIKRSICETARIKFSTRNIIGELIHILLLPSSTGDTKTEYYEAELAGINLRTNCASVYRKCPLSILELFSIIRKESSAVPIYLM